MFTNLLEVMLDGVHDVLDTQNVLDSQNALWTWTTQKDRMPH